VGADQGLSGVASEVATITEELESLADALLPTADVKEAGKRGKAEDASLTERLKKAWNGQVLPCLRLCHAAHLVSPLIVNQVLSWLVLTILRPTFTALGSFATQEDWL
jgi:hypothetical protein